MLVWSVDFFVASSLLIVHAININVRYCVYCCNKLIFEYKFVCWLSSFVYIYWILYCQVLSLCILTAGLWFPQLWVLRRPRIDCRFALHETFCTYGYVHEPVKSFLAGACLLRYLDSRFETVRSIRPPGCRHYLISMVPSQQFIFWMCFIPCFEACKGLELVWRTFWSYFTVTSRSQRNWDGSGTSCNIYTLQYRCIYIIIYMIYII